MYWKLIQFNDVHFLSLASRIESCKMSESGRPKHVSSSLRERTAAYLASVQSVSSKQQRAHESSLKKGNHAKPPIEGLARPKAANLSSVQTLAGDKSISILFLALLYFQCTAILMIMVIVCSCFRQKRNIFWWYVGRARESQVFNNHLFLYGSMCMLSFHPRINKHYQWSVLLNNIYLSL